MTISTFDELKTAAASWLHRADLTSQIPDFISLAEAKLNRRLRLRAQETTATGTVSATVALPTSFIGMRSLTVSAGGKSYPLTYVTPELITSETGQPTSYTIIGDNLVFQNSTTGYTYTLVYYVPFAALSAGVNWLITNAPDVYLYATLLEAAPYLKDDQRAGVWNSLLADALILVEKQDKGDRFGSGLAVRVS